MSSWEEKGREEVERLRGNKSFLNENRVSSHVFIVSVKEFDKEVWGNKDHRFRVDETVPRSVATGTWRTHCVLALGSWANLATDWCTGLTRQRHEQPSHSTSYLVYKPITVELFSPWQDQVNKILLGSLTHKQLSQEVVQLVSLLPFHSQ